ncbi:MULTISPECIES: type IV pilus modification protein PilV [Pseudomonas nitroreducens/multiresinivorans group]|nr:MULTISPECIES: type IV pilus modification protein PilV [Pseudomonas nitroreducens/multiresinivorans group]
MKYTKMKSAKGFSMIEVLVSLLLICVGVLGMVAMQSRNIQYTQSSSQRNTAAMLASDLIEMIRSNRDAVLSAGGQISTTSNYYKAANSAFPTSAVAACRTASGCSSAEMATDQMVLWSRQVSNALPIDAALSTSSYVVCVDSTPATDACDNIGSTIKIQLAWYSQENVACTVPNQPCGVDTANRREFYRISFEP